MRKWGNLNSGLKSDQMIETLATSIIMHLKSCYNLSDPPGDAGHAVPAVPKLMGKFQCVN